MHAKRARLDVQTAMAFLSTRVKEPDQDDWKKPQQSINYLRGTQDPVLTLSADDSFVMKWHVDGSHLVHQDMKGHTGANPSLGTGTIHAKSAKQKLNARSSAETELVSVDDCMPQTLWTNLFMKEQGHSVGGTVAHQDNKSTTLLENNGTFSGGKRTKHIQARFHFITDQIKKGNVSIEHCPTKEMIADFSPSLCKVNCSFNCAIKSWVSKKKGDI